MIWKRKAWKHKEISSEPVEPLKPFEFTKEEKENMEKARIKEEKQAKELEDEMALWPKEKDMVRIKLNGMEGQVIFIHSLENPSGAFPMSGCHLTFLSNDKWANTRHIYELNCHNSRWEIRLKNGSVISNLRHWEIEKV